MLNVESVSLGNALKSGMQSSILCFGCPKGNALATSLVLVYFYFFYCKIFSMKIIDADRMVLATMSTVHSGRGLPLFLMNLTSRQIPVQS